MNKLIFFIIFLSINFTFCNGQTERKEESTIGNSISNMANDNFKDIIDKIKTSDIYENPKNWEARGLNPSDRSVIIFLRKVTNDFLTKLEMINNLNQSLETKQQKVTLIVEELPWNQLETEEKEFLVDTLYPAFKAAGIDADALF